MLKAEISLYPVSDGQANKLTGLSVQFLTEHGLDHDSQLENTSLNTTISGNPDEVWAALRHIFQTNKNSGQDVVMVTTLTSWE